MSLAKQSTKLTLFSHLPQLIDLHLHLIKDFTIKPPIRLAPNITRLTLNRSPFVHGKHQDTFEIREHKCSVELDSSEGKNHDCVVSYLSSSMTAGVGVEVERIDWEPLTMDELERDDSK